MGTPCPDEESERLPYFKVFEKGAFTEPGAHRFSKRSCRRASTLSEHLLVAQRGHNRRLTYLTEVGLASEWDLVDLQSDPSGVLSDQVKVLTGPLNPGIS
ncbi:hypothetical protein STEG23_031810 [Scotinomys teguina]